MLHPYRIETLNITASETTCTDLDLATHWVKDDYKLMDKSQAFHRWHSPEKYLYSSVKSKLWSLYIIFGSSNSNNWIETSASNMNWTDPLYTYRWTLSADTLGHDEKWLMSQCRCRLTVYLIVVCCFYDTYVYWMVILGNYFYCINWSTYREHT